jgi:hypothetical protein
MYWRTGLNSRWYPRDWIFRNGLEMLGRLSQGKHARIRVGRAYMPDHIWDLKQRFRSMSDPMILTQISRRKFILTDENGNSFIQDKNGNPLIEKLSLTEVEDLIDQLIS